MYKPILTSLAVALLLTFVVIGCGQKDEAEQQEYDTMLQELQNVGPWDLLKLQNGRVAVVVAKLPDGLRVLYTPGLSETRTSYEILADQVERICYYRDHDYCGMLMEHLAPIMPDRPDETI